MRDYFIYYDVNGRLAYNDLGEELDKYGLPYIYFREEMTLTIQYLNSPSLTDLYLGFAGETITSTAAVDDDFTHLLPGTLTNGYSGAVTSIEVSGLSGTPAADGNLYLQNGAGEEEAVPYTDVDVTGATHTFTVSTTLTYVYLAADPVNVSESLIIKTLTAGIDHTDKDTGKFVVTLDGDTAAFQNAVNGLSAIPGTLFEHKVYDISPAVIFAVQFTFNCENLLDDDGSVPPPSDASNYYTKAQVDALDAAKQDLVPAATLDNLAAWDAAGQTKDSGVAVDDAGTTSADLWTAQKIQAAIDLGFDASLYQPSVLDRNLTAPPGAPITGDRYIVAAGGTGAWATHDLEITEYNGATWDFIALVEGQTTWVEDENVRVTYNGTAWAISSAGGDMNTSVYDGAGVAEQLVGLTASQALTTKSVNGVTLTTGGVATNFLNATGSYSAPVGSGDMLIATYDAAGVSEQLVGLTASQALTNKSVNAVTLSAAGASTNFLNQAGTYTVPAGAGGDALVDSLIYS